MVDLETRERSEEPAVRFSAEAVRWPYWGRHGRTLRVADGACAFHGGRPEK
jgi:hypothetical protein